MSEWTEFQQRRTPGRRAEDLLKDEIIKSKRSIFSLEEILKIIAFVIGLLLRRNKPQG